MNDATLRIVKIAAIAMAVLIVLGTTTLFVMLAKRGASGSSLTQAQIASILDEPPGTRIGGIAAVQDRLAVQLTGGGADRVVLIDPQTGRITGRVALAR